MTSINRLLAGATILILFLWLVHFLSKDHSGILASNLLIVLNYLKYRTTGIIAKASGINMPKAAPTFFTIGLYLL